MEFFTTPLIWGPVQTSILELIAVFFGLASVWSMKKEHILVYPFGIVNVLIYVYICYSSGLYAYAGINVFYAVMSVYGWYNWSRKLNDSSRRVITRCSKREWGLLLVSVGGLFALVFYILKSYTGSAVPFWDALTTAIYIVGMLLLAWKKIENWIFWIIGDLISVGLFIAMNLWFSGLQFAVFTIIAIAGFLEWKKKLSGSR